VNTWQGTVQLGLCLAAVVAVVWILGRWMR
jgi:hypothetical protein